MSSFVLKNLTQPRLQPVIEPAARPSVASDEDDLLDTLAVVVEHTPVAIAMFDHQMRYVMANRQWVQEFNLSQSLPLLGKSQYEVFPKLHPGWRQLYERALQGYTMRSDHPLQTAAGAPPVVFRCEVRPWRQKRDASVAGVVVTCTKLTGSGLAAPAAAGDFDWSAMELPVFLLDQAGRILAANPRAAELSLARGLAEGATDLWEVLADEGGRQGLKKAFEELAGRLRASAGASPQLLTLKSSPPPAAKPGEEAEPASAPQPPCRWMLARHGEDGSRLVLVGLTGLSPFEAVARVGIQLPAPVPQNGQPRSTGAAQAAVSAEGALEKEVAALREKVARLQMELRTHRDAERTLTRREAQRQSVLEALPGGVLILDEQGRPQWQNARLRGLLGQGIESEQTVEAWLAQACPDGEHREQVRRIWREDVWRRQLTRTLSLVARDGVLREIELRPVSLAQDGLLVFFQDVTVACRLEEQLTALESKFRVLLQDNPLPVVIADKAGSIYDANRAALELFQRSKPELRRLPVDAVLSSESAAARRDALRELRQSGGLKERLTVRLAGEDAPRMHLTLAVVPSADGGIHSTLHFFETPLAWSTPPSPVTAPPAVEAGEEPGQEPEPVSAEPEAPEPQPVLLLETSVSGRVRVWTEQAERLFGHRAEQAQGMPLHQLFQPSDASAFYGATLPEAIQQGRAEWAFFGCDGRRGRVACMVRAVGQGGGQAQFWVLEAQS